ncbi:hypothetical protein TIFTF001_022328 [Ficus carica]|uniref:Uncharacterized protein n=1 Tax=Ficus carica TaxID=3494 RepID=A0AA88DEF2_FICCA|nr:hypothetical protein TIFTF001_022328 [Ficus carica]
MHYLWPRASGEVWCQARCDRLTLSLCWPCILGELSLFPLSSRTQPMRSGLALANATAVPRSQALSCISLFLCKSLTVGAGG